MRFTAIALAVAAVVLLSVPAWAHHSHVNYNTTEFTTVSGTITEVVWTNPHVWIYMDVTDAQGRPRMWAMEGGSVTSLMRGGWQRNSIKPGDKICVRCNRLRDGS